MPSFREASLSHRGQEHTDTSPNREKDPFWSLTTTGESYGTSIAQATTFQRSLSWLHRRSRVGDSSSPKLNWLADR